MNMHIAYSALHLVKSNDPYKNSPVANYRSTVFKTCDAFVWCMLLLLFVRKATWRTLLFVMPEKHLLEML